MADAPGSVSTNQVPGGEVGVLGHAFVSTGNILNGGTTTNNGWPSIGRDKRKSQKENKLISVDYGVMASIFQITTRQFQM